MTAVTVKEMNWMRYRPTRAAEDFLGDLRTSLGLPDKATAGRLALARSLAIPISDTKELALGQDIEKGTAIQGVHLFGDDSDLWGCLVAASTPSIVEEGSHFRDLVEAHWHRGARLLQEDYVECGRDDIAFIVKLANLVPGHGINISPTLGGVTASPVTHPVTIAALAEKEPWQLNAAGGNGLMVISGRPGSGKSQLALDLLLQASRQGVRFLFFDLKGELEDAPENLQQQEKRRDFLEESGATYIRLISDGLPINPLFKGGSSAENAQIASEIAHLVRCFASQLGANQERVIKDSFEDLDTPDFQSLAQSLRDHGEDGVALSIVDKLSSFNIFSAAEKSVPIGQWLSTSKVIDLKSLGNDNDTKALVVAFILNAIMRQLNSNLPVVDGIQPLQMILFVDEAHLLLPKEGKAGLLGSLARQGRSWGFPVWLASQDADAFVTKGQHATDFSELADCGVHLSPTTLSEAQQKQILGQVLHKKVSAGEGVLRLRGATTVGKIRQFWRDKGAPFADTKKA
jgi:DNA sulfur modification protein DndE